MLTVKALERHQLGRYSDLIFDFELQVSVT